MRILWEKLLLKLQQLKADIDEPIPACPKSADIVCSLASGNCEQGNKSTCIQWCAFFVEKRRFFIPVTFVIKPNSRDGFILAESSCIKNLVLHRILLESDIKKLC